MTKTLLASQVPNGMVVSIPEGVYPCKHYLVSDRGLVSLYDGSTISKYLLEVELANCKMYLDGISWSNGTTTVHG